MKKNKTTLNQIVRDYNKIMESFEGDKSNKEKDKINTHVYFEQFSVYDKKMVSQTTAKLI